VSNGSYYYSLAWAHLGKTFFSFLSVNNPTPLTATATIGVSVSSIRVAWSHPTRDFLGRQLLGYYIRYQAVRQGGKPIPELQVKPASTVIICANHSDLIFADLPSYTMYKFEVAPITADGKANYSEPVFGGTQISLKMPNFLYERACRESYTFFQNGGKYNTLLSYC